MNKLKVWICSKIYPNRIVRFPNIPLRVKNETIYQLFGEDIYMYKYITDKVAIISKVRLDLRLLEITSISTLSAMKRRNLISYEKGVIKNLPYKDAIKYKNSNFLVLNDENFNVKVYKILNHVDL